MDHIMRCDHSLGQKDILKFIYCFMILILIIYIFKYFYYWYQLSVPWGPGTPAYKHQVKTTAPASQVGGTSGAATCPRGSDSRLTARGSSGATTCPCGSISRLLAWGSSGAATWHLGSNTHHLAHGSSRAATCPEDGFCRPQANKQIPPGDQAIMISIRACTRVSSKTLRDKGCSARSQGVQQTTH
jgi:hypothetical protein